MTVYVADTFRGAGSIHNSPPQDRHPSVENWSIYTPWSTATQSDSHQAILRSANGLTYNTSASGTNTGGPWITAKGEVTYAASGVTVIEALIWGEGQLWVNWISSLYGGAAANADISIRDSGGASVVDLNFDGDTGFSVLPNSFSPAQSYVLRIEIDATVTNKTTIRGYVDGVLYRTSTVNNVVRWGINWVYLRFNSSINPWTNVLANPTIPFCDYINTALMAASGPLGAPLTEPTSGAEYSLPPLEVVGRQYGRGNAAFSVPRLLADGGESLNTNVVWDNLVRSHERRRSA
jgi:hypothetical protein